MSCLRLRSDYVRIISVYHRKSMTVKATKGLNFFLYAVITELMSHHNWLLEKKNESRLRPNQSKPKLSFSEAH